MDEPSDDARDVLARYRRARVLDDGARTRVRARLVVSIDDGVADGRVAGRRISARRPIIVVAAVALATAAAVILAASSWWDPSHAVATSSPLDDAAMFGRDDGAPRATTIPPAEPPRVATPPASIEPSIEPSIDSATHPATLPRASASPSTHTVPGTAPAPIPADPDRVLTEELALVRGARRALDAGDTAAALAHLATHSRRFAVGQLAEERDAVRIEALCAAGKGAQARAEAQLFTRRWPDSTHAVRVARACPR